MSAEASGTTGPQELGTGNGHDWKIRGQDRVVRELRRAVTVGPRHAYILSGPAHSGKLSCATEFAAALLCPNSGDDAIACHACSICRRIERGVFPDLSIIDLDAQALNEKSQGKNLSLTISTVRRIGADVSLRPSEAPWRVVIVNDVETMQETAQEAFLKTLEEPPGYVVIVLLTTDADLLLPTILSRCVTLRMGTPSSTVVKAALVERGVEESRARDIATLSDGSIGWAVTAATDPSLVEERARVRTRAREWIAAGHYDRLVAATLLADGFVKDREAVFVELLAAQREWRAILHAVERVDGDRSPVDFPPAHQAFSSSSVVSSLRSIDVCITNLEANVRPRLALQTMVGEWPGSLS
ncbi:MAG: hypothetical protein AVDCRST_MAG87-2729 [uncultured Thermomicrobiales bacterium]|uniref:DNA-directed DNA polymerase n=1 Tax=uncultured Thermomicrobiales bacterium TaxID=1645740 RepID=A0A6J4VAZ1_9BACT|nr:MAG: hypothetical protein AVDCRST_MAG87-2729 [uncultured Thermomicrobiales bacterium]